VPVSEKDIELIQKYLAEQMSSKDQGLFKSKVKDADFKKELLFQSQALDALTDVDEESIISFLKDDTNQKGDIDETTKKTYKPFIYLIGILLTLALAAFLFNSNLGDKVNKSNEPLAMLEKYNQLYPAELITRGENQVVDKKLDEAFANYSNGKFQKALSLFNEINPASEKIKMYRANCLLQLKRYAEASELFQEMRSASDKNLKDNADWYYLMSSIGLENNEKVNSVLKQITEDQSHLFNKRAKELLSDLN